MAKSKGKSSRKKGGQVEEVVQCPHLHFKTDVIDRNVLSKEQHLNLLSTPKGYRWEEYKKEGGDGGPVEEISPARRILCSGRRMKKAEKVYVHNFLAEVWNLLTPEMVDRLKGMLMNEFGMSPQEADHFICKQREENIVNSSTVSFYKKPRDIGDGKYVYDHVVKMRNPNKAHCDKVPKSNIGIRNTWIKDFSDSLSDKMSSYVLDTMCAERTDRQKEIAQTLLNRFNTLLEQNAAMADPKTPTDKTLVLVADRLATWLDNNVGVSKEAGQQIKIFGEAEKRKKVEEERKRRHEEMKKERERREAEEEAQRLADEQTQKLAEEAQKLAGEEAQKLSGEEAQKLSGEEAQKLSGEDQDKKLSEQEQGQKLVEEEKLAEREETVKTPGGPEEPTSEIVQGETTGELAKGQAAEQKEEGEERKTEEESSKKESEEAKLDTAEIKEQDEQKEKEGNAATVAEEQQRAVDELKNKEEEGKAAAAAAEAEKLKAEEEQKKTAEGEEAAAKSEQQRIEEEQKQAEQAAEAEKQRAEEDNRKAEEEQQKAAKEAAELAEVEKQKAADEEKKKTEEAEVEPKKASEEPANEKPVSELPERPLDVPVGPSEIPVEDVPRSEATESEPPVSDIEDKPVPLVEKREEPITTVKEKPVDEVKPEVAGPVEGLSPEEREKRTNEVLKSVASIILETKVDPSPRQEALKDIMSKQLEENLGDKDKEAIDKVSSKVGTWVDKMVDQATLEYGEREPSRPPPGPDDMWAPASSRAQPPVSVPSGQKVPAESGLVPGVTGAPSHPGWVPGVAGAPSQPGWVPGGTGAPSQPGWVPGVDGAPSQPGWVPGVAGAPTQPGLAPGVATSPMQPGWVPGAPVQPGWAPGGTGVPAQPGWSPGAGTAPGQPGRVARFGQTQEQPGWLPGVSGVQQPVSPGTRVPVSQRPKGRIYHLSRAGSGFDVNVISNTRAQEKIRLARGKSPAYSNVPNPDAPMEPSDLKKWYKWTSALGEVAENWAEWIMDTIKGTQQRGEDMVRDNSPQRLSEWREFRDNQAQSARKWQQMKKEMEQRAEMWSKKGRKVQSR